MGGSPDGDAPANVDREPVERGEDRTLAIEGRLPEDPADSPVELLPRLKWAAV